MQGLGWAYMILGVAMMALDPWIGFMFMALGLMFVVMD